MKTSILFRKTYFDWFDIKSFVGVKYKIATGILFGGYELSNLKGFKFWKEMNLHIFHPQTKGNEGKAARWNWMSSGEE